MKGIVNGNPEHVGSAKFEEIQSRKGSIFGGWTGDKKRFAIEALRRLLSKGNST